MRVALMSVSRSRRLPLPLDVGPGEAAGEFRVADGRAHRLERDPSGLDPCPSGKVEGSEQPAGAAVAAAAPPGGEGRRLRHGEPDAPPKPIWAPVESIPSASSVDCPGRRARKPPICQPLACGLRLEADILDDGTADHDRRHVEGDPARNRRHVQAGEPVDEALRRPCRHRSARSVPCRASDRGRAGAPRRPPRSAADLPKVIASDPARLAGRSGGPWERTALSTASRSRVSSERALAPPAASATAGLLSSVEVTTSADVVGAGVGEAALAAGRDDAVRSRPSAASWPG